MTRSGVISAAGTLSVAAIVSVVAFATLGAADRGVGAQASGERYGETVVLSGVELAAFAGALGDELWVWTWHDGEWHLQPSQLDERDAVGDYVADEGDGLDEGDELVFPLDLAGVTAPPGEWPPATERRLPPMVVRVTDPLDEAFEAVAYVFLSRGGPDISVPDLVTFDRESLEVRSDAYVLGFADSFVDGFVGYKRLSLFGSDTDLLDRLKIRIAVRIANVEQELTEEQLELIPGLDLPGLTPNPVIAGPVRIVLDTSGAAMAYRERFSLALEGIRDIELPQGFQLQGVRCSLDCSAHASGALYSDSNTPDGVAVDGAHDSVADSPVPTWREIASTDGRLVVLSGALGPAVSARAYYKDDSSIDPDDTGDLQSYADNGVSAPDVDQFVNAGFPGQLVAVPSAAGLTAEQLSDQADAPLLVEVSVGTPPETATSPASSATPTSPPATTAAATVPATSSATATFTRTATPPTPPTPTATASAGGPTSPPTTAPTTTPTIESTNAPTTESTPGPTETAAGGGSPTRPPPSPTDGSPTPEPEWPHTIAMPLCAK